MLCVLIIRISKKEKLSQLEVKEHVIDKLGRLTLEVNSQWWGTVCPRGHTRYS